MKSSFSGYYPPTDEEYKRLWNEALIVLDTNVLLNLYRLPSSARNEFLTALETLKDRLWIPYQVALEFQRHRLGVIAQELKSTNDVLISCKNQVAEMRKKVETLQIEKRGLDIDPKPLLEEIEQANQKLLAAVEATHKSQYEIGSNDPVRTRLDALLLGRIGAGPKKQADLDELVKDGEERFRDYIPPGFSDGEKDKNPKEATFIHCHLKYQRKFGDLILWKQLILQAKTDQKKCVLLVTGDTKEDWWWREQGKTLGPHSELVSEIQREAGVELFWMYTFVEFVKHADKYTPASISAQSVEELQHVGVFANVSSDHRDFDDRKNHVVYDSRNGLIRPSFDSYGLDAPPLIEERVATWVKSMNSYVTINPNPHGFPDLIGKRGSEIHGYEIKFTRNIDRMIISPRVNVEIFRGYLEIQNGRLSSFTLVIVISESEFIEICNSVKLRELSHKLGKMQSQYPIVAIVVGAVLSGNFEVLIWQREQDELNFDDSFEDI